MHSLSLLLLGSLGPSTVTLMAWEYVAYCTGSVTIVIVTVSILPKGIKDDDNSVAISVYVCIKIKVNIHVVHT